MVLGPTERTAAHFSEKTSLNGAKMTLCIVRHNCCEDNISKLVTRLVLRLFACRGAPLSFCGRRLFAQQLTRGTTQWFLFSISSVFPPPCPHAFLFRHQTLLFIWLSLLPIAFLLGTDLRSGMSLVYISLH